ncbi:phospholipid-translocating P-type ATPase [Saitoella complicata NRRL Y-17804]|nr:phospholipid-translocating P-type ATPase [Saitoella complicata NRRL Y-17804]ODQ51850.1 phospholipid-translocating P-type ATPase [Saitoella complicata NRRL Y-17804]
MSDSIPLRTFRKSIRDEDSDDDDFLDRLGEVEEGRFRSEDDLERPLIGNGVNRTEKQPPRSSLESRTVNFTATTRPEPSKAFPPNTISNTLYTPLTFLPLTLYHQFRSFFNLYFLLIALSQAIPVLRIGYLSTYIAPLVFVLGVTLAREAVDDLTRRRRDREANSELYETVGGEWVRAGQLRVGDVVRLEKDRRVPADVVLISTGSNGNADEEGEVFIRTDQLDGETDWKLRVPALPSTVSLLSGRIEAEGPSRYIHNFAGRLVLADGGMIPLSVENALWTNTVLASGTAIGVVVYTGRETRAGMSSTKTSGGKTGKLEFEINNLSKILCALTLSLSIGLVAAGGFDNGSWYIDITRFLILFSTIIPVSLRVNLDLSKSVYAHQIEHDATIPDTIVRTSTIPEELGRVEYLLTDKTGTLTRNEMEMRRVHVGSVGFGEEDVDDVRSFVANQRNTTGGRGKREVGQKVRDLVLAMALCHNVTPTNDANGFTTYQAASPDEIAIVKWTEEVGLTLKARDRRSITLWNSQARENVVYDVLHLFPFTSETKRMGIVVRERKQKPEKVDGDIGETGEDGGDDVWFFEKGADVAMQKIVKANDWVEEEGGNMAREGLRTLVVGRKRLNNDEYESFRERYEKAGMLLQGRDVAMQSVVSGVLERDVELLGMTGVEDKLQDDVKPSLEVLRNAGVKIWMLTGDKVETAKCVAISAKLVARGQYIHTVTRLQHREDAIRELEFLGSKTDSCLLIDGESIQLFLDTMRSEFVGVATVLPAVIACRCTPTQKADIAMMIKEYTKRRVCCIGDGGNDVSMIQAADVGVGIVGKEGKQASLAADFSVLQFSFLTKLLLWHGRNSYKRSAKLAQFVIHRGLVIAVCQTVFSVSSKYAPIALHQGWLLVGYATIYTMFPVFSFVLDRDVSEGLAQMYPELYKELKEGRTLSYRSFFVWVAVSVYQGCVIQILAQFLVGLIGSNDAPNAKMVAVSFTALVLNELAMAAFEITTWHRYMIIAQICTATVYFVSIPFLGDYFDLAYVVSIPFVWKTALVLGISLIPPIAARWIRRRLKPPSYVRLQR